MNDTSSQPEEALLDEANALVEETEEIEQLENEDDEQIVQEPEETLEEDQYEDGNENGLSEENPTEEVIEEVKDDTAIEQPHYDDTQNDPAVETEEQPSEEFANEGFEQTNEKEENLEQDQPQLEGTNEVEDDMDASLSPIDFQKVEALAVLDAVIKPVQTEDLDFIAAHQEFLKKLSKRDKKTKKDKKSKREKKEKKRQTLDELQAQFEQKEHEGKKKEEEENAESLSELSDLSARLQHIQELDAAALDFGESRQTLDGISLDDLNDLKIDDTSFSLELAGENVEQSPAARKTHPTRERRMSITDVMGNKTTKPKKAKKWNANQITDHIFIGDAESARDLEEMKLNGITHVLSLIGNRPHFPQDIEYLIHHDVDDAVYYDIMSLFPESNEFIGNAISKGGKVMVHCMQGVSRSTSIVMGYLMAKNGMNFDQAADLVSEKRSVVQPNFGFLSQLQLWEKLSFNLDGDTVYHYLYRKIKLVSKMSQLRAKWYENNEGITEPYLGDVWLETEVKEEIKNKEDVSNNHIKDGVMCKACMKILFPFKVIITHDDQPPVRNEATLPGCACFFVPPFSWMGSLKESEGNISCTCGANVGKFKWDGVSCSCGRIEKPGFLINRDNVWTTSQAAREAARKKREEELRKKRQQDIEAAKKKKEDALAKKSTSAGTKKVSTVAIKKTIVVSKAPASPVKATTVTPKIATNTTATSSKATTAAAKATTTTVAKTTVSKPTTVVPKAKTTLPAPVKSVASVKTTTKAPVKSATSTTKVGTKASTVAPKVDTKPVTTKSEGSESTTTGTKTGPATKLTIKTAASAAAKAVGNSVKTSSVGTTKTATTNATKTAATKTSTATATTRTSTAAATTRTSTAAATKATTTAVTKPTASITTATKTAPTATPKTKSATTTVSKSATNVKSSTTATKPATSASKIATKAATKVSTLTNGKPRSLVSSDKKKPPEGLTQPLEQANSDKQEKEVVDIPISAGNLNATEENEPGLRAIAVEDEKLDAN